MTESWLDRYAAEIPETTPGDGSCVDGEDGITIGSGKPEPSRPVRAHRISGMYVSAQSADIGRLAAERGYTVGPVHHGTPFLFNEFSHTKDIGFHFGTEQSAKERNKSPIEFSLKEEEPSVTEAISHRISAGTFQTDTASDELLALLIRKLEYPSVDRISAEIGKMDDVEIASLISEYAAKPDSERFHARAERGAAGTVFVVEAGGESKRFNSKPDAEKFMNGISKRTGNSAYYLAINRSVETPDLGTWPAHGIAEECGFSPAEMKKVYGSADPYSEIVSILGSKGVNGIEYENAVEDAGSVSYIAFYPWQIKLADAVTYDDDGDPIPSSKRFDKTSNDVRY